MKNTSSAIRSGGSVEVDGLIDERESVFRVSRKVYADPDVFEAEMDRIFAGTWIFVAHESEIPNPGSYKTTYIGREPVIVARSQDGAVNVMYNRCRHRGATVCRESSGCANFFRCPYHGWVYGSDGTLVGVSQRPGAYADTWEQPSGLQHLGQVGTYRGLIFASVNPDVETLDEWLGETGRRWIDQKFGLSPVGEIRLTSAPLVVRCRGNWKFPIENILDGYHYLSVHTPFMKVQERYGDTTGDYKAHVGGTVATQGSSVGGSSQPYVTPQGHLFAFRSRSDEAVQDALTGELSDYYRTLLDQHGEEQLPFVINGGIAQMYPNLGIIHHQLRVVRPISVDLTEISIYPYELVGAPDEYNVGWLHSQERFYGPTGYGMPDDYEMFELNQQGLQASAVEWLILERGITTDQVTEDGLVQGSGRGPETQIRGQMRRWRALMGAGVGSQP